MGKVKLNILGLSNSQNQTGAYALLLSEVNGDRRLPIVIGAFEAQSIALQLENLIPPRPLTHDLFLNFSNSFKITIKEVNIYKLKEGVFFAELVCVQDGKENKIDSRTSDAIALALRFKCPIYTTEEILNKAGIIMDLDTYDEKKESEKQVPKKKQWSQYTLKVLNEKLNEAIDKEDYEKASEISEEIKKRKKK